MLEPILESTRRRIAVLPPIAELRGVAIDRPPARDFVSALMLDRLAVIAEVKRRSPSRGDLAPDLDPVKLALRYVQGGASCISVLTEPVFFSGSNQDLIGVSDSVNVPVLRKDFTLDPAQVWEARTIGADAVLLIVAALDSDRLSELIGTAKEAGLAALVEVHDEAEVEIALAAGADLVGVNNRNLKTFEIDLSTSERLAPLLADAKCTVGESGIRSSEDARRLKTAGYRAVLVGESLVLSERPELAVESLRV